MNDDVFAGKAAKVDPDEMDAYMSLALSSTDVPIKEALKSEAEKGNKAEVR
jgi:hypothetical protein